ncbi:MAG: FtsX-like permease family protein [Thermotogota bacterium]|nr:FtsX-like permease family protein [Thermotogota bacterium]
MNQNQKIEFEISQVVVKSLIASNFAKVIFVINDEHFEKLKNRGMINHISMFEVDQATDSKVLRHNILQLLPKKTTLRDFYSVYQQMIEGRGLFVFICAFLGIVFLVATGTIMFFRQLTEINEEKENYIILRNIGLTKKELGKTIKKQIILIFGLPVILGIIHAYVATDILSQIMNINLLFPIIASFSAYCCIYFVFYWLTVSSSIKMLSVK